jgi:hypothetical protein
MQAGTYIMGSIQGFASMARAVSAWSSNPLRATVLRRLWGPVPWCALLVIAAASAAFERWVPDPRTLTGVFPPLMFLAFVPDVVVRFIVSGPAVLGFVGAWRVRTLRDRPGGIDGPWSSDGPPGALAFEAAVLPLGAAALLAAVTLLVVEVANPDTDITVVWAVLHINDYLSIAAVSGGVFVARHQLGKAFGQLLAAAFSIWVMHMVIGFVAPWATVWWEWIPGLGDRSRPVTLVHAALDAAIVSIAWITVRHRFAEGVAWRIAPEENPNDSQ